MRFIVFFTIILIPLKIGIIIVLFMYRNKREDEKYVVSLGIAKIFLTANENNPISKALPEIVLPFL
jgi:hypothetical protein